MKKITLNQLKYIKIYHGLQYYITQANDNVFDILINTFDHVLVSAGHFNNVLVVKYYSLLVKGQLKVLDPNPDI